MFPFHRTKVTVLKKRICYAYVIVRLTSQCLSAHFQHASAPANRSSKELHTIISGDKLVSTFASFGRRKYE